MSPSQRALLIIGAIVVLLVLGGGLYLLSGMKSTQQDNTSSGKTNTMTNSAENQNAQAPAESTASNSPAALAPASSQAAKSTGHIVTLATSVGDIQFSTYDADAPKTVENFITLAKKGFYSNLTFHRVIKGFMIQGGDPLGDGTGGPGYAFADELNPTAASYRAGYKKGVVAMANAGPNTNGSQFFIMLEDTPLPKSYTIFGHVTQGQNVVDAIGSVSTGANDRPLKAVTIKSAKVEDVSQ